MDFAAAVARMDLACEGVFGEDATLNGEAVRGIFRAPYADPMGLATTDPTFRLRTVAAGLAVQDAVLVCTAGTFRVRVPQPDGTGWTTLTLERLA